MEEIKHIEEELKEKPLDKPELSKIQSAKIPKGTFEVLQPGKFDDKYILGEFLGKGSFGTVNKCFLIENRKVIRAVKLVKKDLSDKQKDSFVHEMEMLKKASHPNVL
jgi:serine/threonine protein kinase